MQRVRFHEEVMFLEGKSDLNPINFQLTLVDVLRSGEPCHDKTKQMSLRPAKTQIRLGTRPV